MANKGRGNSPGSVAGRVKGQQKQRLKAGLNRILSLPLEMQIIAFKALEIEIQKQQDGKSDG